MSGLLVASVVSSQLTTIALLIISLCFHALKKIKSGKGDIAKTTALIDFIFHHDKIIMSR